MYLRQIIVNSVDERGRRLSGSVFKMLMLYGGKVSGILLNLIFIPIYSVKLGPETFGIVAVILSLQSLLLMLDLGMSTVVGRDIAANEEPPGQLLRRVFSAELVLLFFYCALMVVVGGLVLGGVRFGMTPLTLPALVLLFMLLVLRNLHYNTLIVRRSYVVASTLQLVGSLIRAAGTALVLTYVSPTLTAFVIVQVAGAFLQFVMERWLCVREFKADPLYQKVVTQQSLCKSALELLRLAKPAALVSLAGAAVMQVDKPIILFFMGPTSVAPYFLAMTYSMVPMVILAGPVAQFFQPLIINAISTNDEKRALNIMRMFTAALLVTISLPSAMMYLLSNLLVGIWLHHGPLVASTTAYIKILLPGLAIGALGFIPYSLLLANSDYKFMARISIYLTVITLALVALASSQKIIWLVCVVYGIYNATSVILQWVRALHRPRINRLARSSLKLTLVVVLLVVFIICVMVVY